MGDHFDANELSGKLTYSQDELPLLMPTALVVEP